MSPFEKLTVQLMVASLCLAALGILTAVFSADFRGVLIASVLRVRRILARVRGQKISEGQLFGASIAVLCLVLVLGPSTVWRPQEPKADQRVRSTSPATPRPSGSNQKALLTKTIKGIEFALIPNGEANIGCSVDDDQCSRNELPLHQISTSSPFWMAVTEVTTSQFEMCVEQNYCSAVSDEPVVQHVGAERLPMTWLAAEDAQQFCHWLGGELPTETEWEYAARGRLSNCRYPWGKVLSSKEARYRTGAPMGVAEVGSFRPNAFGLYDMAGNVSEFTLGPMSSTGQPFVILRGGSYETGPDRLRVSARTLSDWGFVGAAIGFRCIVRISK